MRVESISGHVRQSGTTEDETQSERRELSVQSEFGRHQRLGKIASHISLCQKSLNLFWRYSDSGPQLGRQGGGRGAVSDVMGRGMCQTAVGGKVGRAAQPKYWGFFVLFFFWKVHARRSHTPVMMGATCAFSRKAPAANRNDWDEARRL